MAVYQRSNSDYFWYDFSENGTRYRGSTKQKTKARAEQYEIEMRISLRNDGSLPARRCPLLRDFALAFLEHVEKSQEYRRKTKLYYIQGTKMLLGTKVAEMRLDRITRLETTYLKWPELSPSTVNCALRTLGVIFTHAIEVGVLHRRPSIPLRNENERKEVIEEIPEAQLLAMMPPFSAEQLVIILDTGLRPEEVCRLRWEYVNFATNRIQVVGGKTKAATRKVPMTDRVHALLKARLKGQTEGWVYPSSRSESGHITPWVLSGDFRRARRALGLPSSLVVYTARHTYATDLLEESGNLDLVSKMLGHSDIKVTTRYTHSRASKAADCMNERNARRAAATAHFAAQSLTSPPPEEYIPEQ